MAPMDLFTWAAQDDGPRTERAAPGRRQGEHGTGPRAYTEADAAAVRRALVGTAADNTATVAELAETTRLNGRTVRAILSERDGVDYLLGLGARGAYYAVLVPEEAGGATARMLSQMGQMGERVRRRMAYADGLRAAQGGHAA